MTEKELKNAIIEVAHWQGWFIHHDLPALDRRGVWRTHIQGDAGFPDLFMIHPTRCLVLVAELKSKEGRVTAAQQSWLDAFTSCGIRAEVWRPADWARVQRLLAGEDV